MEAVLLVIHLIIALAIICFVLLQPSESGGFLGNSGSMSNMMSQRRSGDPMSHATTILAGCFFLTSLLLAIYAGNRPAEKSILDAVAADEAAVTAPAATGTDTPATPKAPISQ